MINPPLGVGANAQAEAVPRVRVFTIFDVNPGRAQPGDAVFNAGNPDDGVVGA